MTLRYLLSLWFVLFHDSPQVNASFQEKDKSQEGSALYRRFEKVACLVMPLHSFPSHCGVGCLVMGPLSLAQEINIVTL